jgi:hypothetical protein
MHISTLMDLKEIRCAIVDWIKLAQDMFVVTARLRSLEDDFLINQLRDYQLIKNGSAPCR